MTERRERFLERLKYRLEGKNSEEQEAEKNLADFFIHAKNFADELEDNQKFVNEYNLYDMFVERNYSGINDIFKLDRDEGMIRLAIEVLMREREEKTTEVR